MNGSQLQQGERVCLTLEGEVAKPLLADSVSFLLNGGCNSTALKFTELDAALIGRLATTGLKEGETIRITFEAEIAQDDDDGAALFLKGGTGKTYFTAGEMRHARIERPA